MGGTWPETPAQVDSRYVPQFPYDLKDLGGACSGPLWRHVDGCLVELFEADRGGAGRFAVRPGMWLPGVDAGGEGGFQDVSERITVILADPAEKIQLASGPERSVIQDLCDLFQPLDRCCGPDTDHITGHVAPAKGDEHPSAFEGGVVKPWRDTVVKRPVEVKRYRYFKDCVTDQAPHSWQAGGRCFLMFF